jgi:hypothetical protein
VLDRFIQQAVMQVLQKRWNPTFSHHSYGFRPYRSAHQAVAQAQQYIVQGYGWVIDLDLEKFFDRVNHDKLMGQIAKRVVDKRLLKLIRAFLKCRGDGKRAGQPERGSVSHFDARRRRRTTARSSRLLSASSPSTRPRFRDRRASATIAASVRRFSHRFNADEVFGTHRHGFPSRPF